VSDRIGLCSLEVDQGVLAKIDLTCSLRQGASAQEGLDLGVINNMTVRAFARLFHRAATEAAGVTHFV